MLNESNILSIKLDDQASFEHSMHAYSETKLQDFWKG